MSMSFDRNVVPEEERSAVFDELLKDMFSKVEMSFPNDFNSQFFVLLVTNKNNEIAIQFTSDNNFIDESEINAKLVFVNKASDFLNILQSYDVSKFNYMRYFTDLKDREWFMIELSNSENFKGLNHRISDLLDSELVNESEILNDESELYLILVERE